MANYSLFTIAYTSEVIDILDDNPHFGRELERLCSQATPVSTIGHTGQPNDSYAELQISDKHVGQFYGRFYDGNIAQAVILPNHIAFVTKHDDFGEIAKQTGADIVKLSQRFAKAADSEAKQNFRHGTVVPVYWNKAEGPKSVEFHKTTCREEGDLNTTWEYNPRTTYHSLVHHI